MMYHPLATHSDGSLVNAMKLKGKVNAQSRATDHESEYNIKLTTILAFNLTVGYSRHQGSTVRTHRHPLGHPHMGLFRGALYKAVAAGDGCHFC